MTGPIAWEGLLLPKLALSLPSFHRSRDKRVLVTNKSRKKDLAKVGVRLTTTATHRGGRSKTSGPHRLLQRGQAVQQARTPTTRHQGLTASYRGAISRPGPLSDTHHQTSGPHRLLQRGHQQARTTVRHPPPDIRASPPPTEGPSAGPDHCQTPTTRRQGLTASYRGAISRPGPLSDTHHQTSGPHRLLQRGHQQARTTVRHPPPDIRASPPPTEGPSAGPDHCQTPTTRRQGLTTYYRGAISRPGPLSDTHHQTSGPRRLLQRGHQQARTAVRHPPPSCS